MDLSKLPTHLKQLFHNKDLTMNQKMATLAAFMPDIPGMSEPDDNHKLGMKIKRLVDEGKIRLKFDKNFKLEIITN